MNGTPASSAAGRFRQIAERISLVIGFVTILFALAVTFPKLPYLPAVNVPEEIVKPLTFGAFMTILVLLRPATGWFLENRPKLTALGIAIDLFVIGLLIAFAFTYLHEITVEKPEMFPEWARLDVDPMARVLGGVPTWVVVTTVSATAMLLYLNWREWGAPIALVAIAAAAYAILTAWFTTMGWFEGKVFLTYNAGARDPVGEIHQFLLVGDQHALLGLFPAILLRIVIPFVVLGTLFTYTGGGRSLIKVAFYVTRRLRGGPGHAAVVSSSLFGTMSGGPVVNVLATGVLTIPMMLRINFTKRFAGGVEAAASSGGQIMPPIMGIAAFFLANFTGVPYAQVILAALIPALLYYFTLFISVSLEARRLDIQAINKLPPDLEIERQDYLNLIIVGVPILVVIAVLASGQFTVTAAGIFAVITLTALSFIDPEIRKSPSRLLEAFGRSGAVAASIMLLFMAVGVVNASLNATGFPGSFGGMVSNLMGDGFTIEVVGMQFVAPQGLVLFVVLTITMLAALLLGMGMPTLPAYANVAIVMGAALGGLGLSLFTANMFVFYFAVASAITPPVAIAAFAAASITRADPLMTALAAVRLGMTLFLIPFVFAFYPELLLINDAFLADTTTGSYIAMRPNGFEWDTFASIMVRVILAIYVLSTAFSRFDACRLTRREVFFRIILAPLSLLAMPVVYLPATAVLIAVLIIHRVKARTILRSPATQA